MSKSTESYEVKHLIIKGHPGYPLELGVPGLRRMHELCNVEGEDLMRTVFDTLGSKLSTLLQLRVMGNQTQEQVGEEYGLTRQGTHHLEQHALHKLCHPRRLKLLQLILDDQSKKTEVEKGGWL